MAERVPPILSQTSSEPLEYDARIRTSPITSCSTPNDCRTDKSNSTFNSMKSWIKTGHRWLHSVPFRGLVAPDNYQDHRHHSPHHDNGGQCDCPSLRLQPEPRVGGFREERLPRHNYHRQHHYHELQKHNRHRQQPFPAVCSTTTTTKTKSNTTTTTTTTTTMTTKQSSFATPTSTMFPPFIFLVLLASTVFRIAEACSSRSTPKPRPPSPTLRPNITFQTYDCPEAYAKWYCLNGATCFSVRIGESILYNCECADGFMGQRCEFKDLDGSYLPSRERVMIETASIAGGVTILVFLIVILSVFACIYFRRKEKLKRMPSDVSQSELDRKPFHTRISSKNPAHLVNTRDPESGRGMSFMPLAASNAHAASELMRSNGRNGNSADT